jgi:SAM-dependent methyltransferase
VRQVPAGGPQLGPAPWEENSEWWARTFTAGADPEYEHQILPLVAGHLRGAGRVLDIGCGEGQVSRHVAAGGRPLVVGVDPAPAQLARAVARGGGARYLRASGEELPFRDGSFDAAVCCLVIEHVADEDAVFCEVARVLAPGGRFLLLVNHPLFQGIGSGLVDDHILGERYWRVGPYLHDDVVVEEVDPGVHIPFAHRPLSGYLNPLADAGLLLTRMEEPAPLAQFLRGSLDPDLEAVIPRLLLLRLERR